MLFRKRHQRNMKVPLNKIKEISLVIGDKQTVVFQAEIN